MQTRMVPRVCVSIKLFGVSEPETAWEVGDVLELGAVFFVLGVSEDDEGEDADGDCG